MKRLLAALLSLALAWPAGAPAQVRAPVPAATSPNAAPNLPAALPSLETPFQPLADLPALETLPVLPALHSAGESADEIEKRRREAGQKSGELARRLDALAEQFWKPGSEGPKPAGALPEAEQDRGALAFDRAASRSESVDADAGAALQKDPFGRDVGWDRMPAEPPEAPRSMAEVSLEIPRDRAYTPSPEDWRDEVFYAVIMDRFGRAEPFTTFGDPADGRTRHGGNIRGLLERLDYLKGLGVTTILVNPILMSPPAGYHQYWAVHLFAVDPQLGTLAEFKELVAEAHKRGLRIVLDTVFNHTGPVAEYRGGFKFGEPRPIEKWNYPVKPVELAREERFTRRGDINDWNNREQLQFGDLPGGINRLSTEHPGTQNILLTAAKWWIKETDVDGFRLDVYKHVAPAFWDRFFPETRAYAAKLGKKNFLLVGELYDGDPNRLEPELKQGRLDSAYNYPAYYWDMAALRGAAATRELESSFHLLSFILGEPLKYLVRFLDNHDRPRFLKPTEPLGVLGLALGFLMTTVGVPYIYYGAEQAFRHVPEHEWLDLDQSREDMFPGGKFRNPAAPVDGFDAEAPLYKLLAKLSAVRRAHAALRRGEQYVRWSDPNGPGIFAFSRIHEGREVLVVLNTSGESRTAEMFVDAGLTPAGTPLVDELGGGELRSYAKDGGSKVTVTAPAHGVRIFVRGGP